MVLSQSGDEPLASGIPEARQPRRPTLKHPAKMARQAAYWRAHGRAEVAERLEAELAGAGRCKRCGRALRDPESVADSIGPECRRKNL
jgi:hypothetical protein